MDIERIGDTMKLLRNSKKWTLQEESKILNIHRNTLAEYEKNPENMSIGLFNKFLDIHNITKDIFFKILYDNSLIKWYLNIATKLKTCNKLTFA